MSIKNGKLVCGVGLNDVENSAKTKLYQCWADMLKRSYSKNLKEKHVTYKDVTCSSDWLLFSKFSEDAKELGYREDWCLDKDILVPKNKHYSKETCCFVPVELNNIIIKRVINPTGMIGVYFEKNCGKYRACISVGKKQIRVGLFNNEYDAFMKYKEIKEKHIKEVALKYKDDLRPNVFERFMSFEVHPYD